MTGLRGGSGGRIHREPLPDPSRRREDRIVGQGAGRGPVLPGIRPMVSRGNYMPGTGLQEGG